MNVLYTVHNDKLEEIHFHYKVLLFGLCSRAGC